MPNLNEKLSNEVRLGLYVVTFVALFALAAANVIDRDAVPELLELAGGLLGVSVVGVAGRVLHEQKRDGLL
ncbi:hypothetical protein [Mycobacteroides abscessus]|uniref:hypothetical protein n=1 Tax=Mycobacteroides abscessus TaxID=36809 RepID=UPI00092752C3|nr:hypothetical protein [Mycobacteroides abscessus]DAZ90365.1 TPA_asm: holin [Mycobacterium phage prophiFSQJ01-1]SII41736.1 Uncharacterised protein [Mycobacteroides abscessus subsp. abscessus]SIK13383.1 Uncharacterised protein [Mycobacteroides abscessus subsp. abscessus]SIN25827.1 Uncharacterised protein [Mycobacteroides abscessus subsp. abscessus]SLI51116.1 Uncharacterised protein [Mycobacteroides abscessus subsp. abscessus]